MTATRLLVAEVDGTLLTPDATLTPRTRQAVGWLRDAHVELALTSGRPPRGMRTVIDALAITAPVGGFDGGMLVRPDLSLLEQHVLGDEVAGTVIASMERRGLDVCVYQGDAWLVRRPDTALVAHEAARVQLAPEPVDRWGGRVHDPVEIAGLSDDVDALASCEADLRPHSAYVAVARPRSRALVVRHPRANTGELLRALSRRLGIPADAVAAIGHGPADVVMFRECGLAIAMGQAGAAVQRQARFITRSNEAEGFAHAVETWVLGTLVPDEPPAATSSA